MSNHYSPIVPGLPFTRPTLVGGPTSAPAPKPANSHYFGLGSL